MRHSLKCATAFVMAVLMMLGACLPVYGASSKEKIEKVKLKVDCKEKPEAGKAIGTVTVSVSDTKVGIEEPARYYDTEEDVWVFGEIPIVRVELSVKDFNKYRFTSSTQVTVTGFHSELKSKKVTDGGKGLLVDIKLSKVSGPLEAVEDCYWDGRTAKWSGIDYAYKYEVRLYRGNSLITTITTKSCCYNFQSNMTKSGDYTFKVRGISDTDGKKGEWSDKSDEYYVSPEDVDKLDIPGSPDGQAGWIQDSTGWVYRQKNGGCTRNSWLYVDENWFYLAEDCYMKTDWIFVDNNWFYLNPISDGTRGAMKTGWQCIDGTYYYLNPVSDGTRGAMKTSWQYINGAYYYLNPISDGTRGAMKTGYQYIDGAWFYLDPGSGALWTNRQAPDGRWADENGRLSG